MAVDRNASTTWEGDLFKGQGTLSLDSSGIGGQLPVTWASRTARADGTTSPEELLAAAQASCYAMALSNTLAGKGTPPTRLHVTATATFDPPRVTTMAIHVRGQVPGLDQAAFEAAARAGEQGCPIANAIRNNVEIQLTAELEA